LVLAGFLLLGTPCLKYTLKKFRNCKKLMCPKSEGMLGYLTPITRHLWRHCQEHLGKLEELEKTQVAEAEGGSSGSKSCWKPY
jgi:hypothetical protein